LALNKGRRNIEGKLVEEIEKEIAEEIEGVLLILKEEDNFNKITESFELF